MYSQEFGRFLQVDPIRFTARDVNLYRYVRNEPSRLTDEFGLTWTEGAITITGEWKRTGGQLNVEASAPSTAGYTAVLDTSNNITLTFEADAEVKCICGNAEKTASGVRVAEREANLTHLPNPLHTSPQTWKSLSGFLGGVSKGLGSSALNFDTLGKELTEQERQVKPKGTETGDGWKGDKSPCADIK
jgi:uncharacterized protein RhaS with RHS repeats